jgi:predicted lipase
MDLLTKYPRAKECLQSHDHSDFKLHRGIHYQFMKLYPHLKKKIKEFFDNSNNYCEHEIVVSGHSLAGGLSIMAGIYLYHYMIELRKPHVKIKIVTIGAPRVLNKALANWYNTHLSRNTWRIVNHYDSIPNLPVEGPVFEYTHVNATIVYIKNNALLSRTPNERTLMDRVRSLRAGFSTHGINSYIKNLNKFDILKSTDIC